jgi:hypothetical protein
VILAMPRVFLPPPGLNGLHIGFRQHRKNKTK